VQLKAVFWDGLLPEDRLQKINVFSFMRNPLSIFSYKNTRHKSLTGFTLIELLVVISIVGALASIILASLNSARSKARDAKRISELKQLATALEMYYSNHGDYPPSSPGGVGCWSNWQAGNAVNGAGVQFLQPLVTDGLISRTPLETGNIRDAWGSQCTYRYGRYDLSGPCGGSYQNIAALYTALENQPPQNAGRQPSCLSASWGEGQPGYADYLIILRPN